MTMPVERPEGTIAILDIIQIGKGLFNFFTLIAHLYEHDVLLLNPAVRPQRLPHGAAVSREHAVQHQDGDVLVVVLENNRLFFLKKYVGFQFLFPYLLRFVARVLRSLHPGLLDEGLPEVGVGAVA